ncbi:MAG TPA: hypothetical protein P5120_02390 [Spirochaetota bacterium]|mgnify:FL=1|nr:hypothetical protein [Spirochaetota bacterium]HRX46342.1 hypothetical protein [Spirochaetota bacterium]
MEFFLLFILNIFTGAVIYLILSLKIERTTSTYHEQKLKKEMGEIITEFNSTAERNITLLENRINMMKRLLNEKGDLRGIDLVISDDIIKKGKSSDIKMSIPESKEIPVLNDSAPVKKDLQGKLSGKNDGSILVGIIDKISSIARDITSPADTDKNSPAEKEKEMKELNYKSSTFEAIEDSEIEFPVYSNDDGANIPMMPPSPYEKEEDLALLFSNTPDKYLLIADLYGKGYSVDDLSRYSGLPSGEVRLVISLNR